MYVDYGEQVSIFPGTWYPDHLDVHLQAFHRPGSDHFSIFHELTSGTTSVYPVFELQKAFLLHDPVQLFMVDKIAAPFQVGGHQPVTTVYELVAENLLYRLYDGRLPHMALGLCLLYTSDAADDLLCVDLGGRRIIKK